MPYIKKVRRERFDDGITILQEELKLKSSENDIAGDLHYIIARLLEAVPIACGQLTWRYRFINLVIGVLECCKQEFYRRLAGPYEDSCVEYNGDIPLFNGS